MNINPEFQSLIPKLSDEEFSQLETNILADGCRDPIVTWVLPYQTKGYCRDCHEDTEWKLGDGNVECEKCGFGVAPEPDEVIIDGHNRYSICQKHNLQFDTEPMEFKDESDAKVWIIRNQFGRRNLSSYTRATLALKLEPLLKEKAKERQIRKPESVVQNSAPQKGKSRDDVARVAHVSHDTIAKAKVIEAKATPEVKAALHSGETSINAEYKKLTVHVGHNSGENEWYTPPCYIDAVRVVMGDIDCDPASSEIANKTVKAKTFYTKEDDGLSRKWHGRVFLNPPYAQPLMGQFASAVSDKFKAEEIEQACILVNNATETEWFQTITEHASAICFPKTRIRFLDPNGNPGAPLQGQAIIYLGPNKEQFCDTFKKFGFVCHVV